MSEKTITSREETQKDKEDVLQEEESERSIRIPEGDVMRKSSGTEIFGLDIKIQNSEHTEMKGGEHATIFYVKISNNTQKSRQIDLKHSNLYFQFGSTV